ncbi:hypothetical protein G9X43_04915 [Cronobacter turicensis]|uniref:hypothetical protein n=2 Tax=Cronobacter turicensis TaxID=413502 RepID=UPI001411F20E|nr:hypothetical protein [Cronobacter turicensis]NHV08868.1 hypothetical protein [Cronobacter turicensis]NHV62246.1 hypothetical protein [Cronobacter turicensis]NHW09187.1 hypothetical protein [Cronobacter turicensis]
MTQIVGWITLRDSILLVLLFFFNTLFAEADMKGEVSLRVEDASNKFEKFIADPKGRNKGYLLNAILEDINDIDISNPKIFGNEYSRLRSALLFLHLNVLQVFDRYYVENFKPDKKYFLKLIPPSGIIEGPALGPVDPSEIKNSNAREAYEKDLRENEKLGREIALQDELKSLKLKLSMYDDAVGVISDTVHFILRNYNNSSQDKNEVKYIINSVFHGSQREGQIYKALQYLGEK